MVENLHTKNDPWSAGSGIAKQRTNKQTTVKESSEEAATPKKAPEEAAEKSPEEAHVKNVRNPVPFVAAPKMKSTLFLFSSFPSSQGLKMKKSPFPPPPISSTLAQCPPPRVKCLLPQKIKDLFSLVSALPKHSLHMNFTFIEKSKFTFFWAGENYGSTKLSENFSGTTFLNPSGEPFS